METDKAREIKYSKDFENELEGQLSVGPER